MKETDEIIDEVVNDEYEPDDAAALPPRYDAGRLEREHVDPTDPEGK